MHIHHVMIKNLRGFLKLLERYQRNELDPKEKRIMDIWYESIDHSDENQNRLSEDQAGKLMWVAMESRMESSDRQEISRRSVRRLYFKLAAACVLLVAGFFSYRTFVLGGEVISGVKNEVLENMRRIQNSGSGSMRFTLSDGSKVVLEPGATLYYPVRFEPHERNVFLKGNVFFEIAHDSSRPFFVHANNIVTKVLGTSFTIRENAKTESIEVAVMTGVVEVRKAEDPQESTMEGDKVILTQNKKVTFFKEEEKLVTGLVETPTLIKTKTEQPHRFDFNYAEKSLPEIVSVLENAYGVRIVIANEKLRNCIINADLSQEKTLFSQLEILCESISAEYQLVGDTVALSGQGCEATK